MMGWRWHDASALRSETHLALKSYRGYPLTLSPQPEPIGPLTADLSKSVTSLVQKLTSPRSDAAILSTDGDLLTIDNDSPLAPPAVTLPPSLARQALTNLQTNNGYLLGHDAQGNQQRIVLLPLVHNDQTVAILQIGTRN
jgi:two-component system, OmpR family, sensor kinase